MAQTIFHNGPILTVDNCDSVVEAVLTESGKILATGSLAEINRQAGPQATRYDLAGRTMIPAFIDPHGHFPDSGYLGRLRADLAPPPVGDCASLGDVFERLTDLVRKTPKGTWVMGSQLEPTSLPENRFPTREEL
ncbi:MAG: amidohydrolase family protein, partial [Paracoccaceae bacterium]|nr:amidohydrolase family protein [Paracoccaceae bacterium]